MKSNADVVFRDVDHSPALAFTINKKLEKLARYTDSIIHSRVVLESPHKHKHKGKLYRASIEIGLKGSPVTVSQDNTSMHIAVREAFNAAERKLKAACDKQKSSRH